MTLPRTAVLLTMIITALALTAILLPGSTPQTPQQGQPNTPQTPPPLATTTASNTPPTPVESPTLEQTTQTPSGTLGGITGGLVVRGAELVQPWVSIEYRTPASGGFSVSMKVSLDRVIVLDPRFPGDASSSRLGEGGPGVLAPMGFWDEERRVLYVMWAPFKYPRALLAGDVGVLDRMFEAIVVPPGVGDLLEARLLPRGFEGYNGTRGLIVLSGDGELLLLPPPLREDDVVISGKSGITRVVFTGRPISLGLEGVEGFTSPLVLGKDGSTGALLLAGWGGDTVRVAAYREEDIGEALQGAVDGLEPRSMLSVDLDERVVEAHLFEHGDSVFLTVLTPGGVHLLQLDNGLGEYRSFFVELPGARFGTLLGDTLLISGELGVYSIDLGSLGKEGAEVLPGLPGGSLLTVYNETLLSYARGEVVIQEAGRLQEPVKVGLRAGLKGEVLWIAGYLAEDPGLAERVKLVHQVGVEGSLFLYLLLAGRDEVVIEAVSLGGLGD